ncbi:MAG: DUF4364 family protein [Clostridia bacterium]|nr:DUF4364 family protein [Clostridia bacterium]
MSLHPPRRSPDDERRLMVLYVIRSFPALTGMQLQQFFFDYNEMNYFDMMFALNDLCANGQALREKAGDNFVYTITPAGEEALSLFGSRLPQSLCRFVEEKGAAFREKMQEDEHYPRQIRKTEDGDYVVSLGIVEKDQPVMQFTVSVPSCRMAQDMVNAWPRRAGKFYSNAVFMLAEEEK